MTLATTLDHVLPRQRLALRGALALILATATACGEAVSPSDLIADASEPLAAGNGLSANGLSKNGLNKNGLNKNGLNKNGLAATDFSTWFNADPASAAAVMKYAYGCAAPAGSTLTWTNPATGVAYTWSGVLGVAPAWTGGTPATAAEQQVVSACLAAHTNYYGRQVSIAVEGYKADGSSIPMAKGEDKAYPVREAVFFGNLFDPADAVYACADHAEWGLEYSSARACAFDYKGGAAPTTLCAPIVYLGLCSAYCHYRPTDMAYDTCTLNGKVYKPISTRLLASDVYKCGDGVCQFTELCGTDKTFDSCKADCGLCP